ncbi:MAG: SDR family NAD(P)-dependent oxidoreductase [Candidatus Hydrogenedentes bacterium]|nr:SDR family NAD(P)-dependent oxidoreductase [Candidatus Hydrogenedentota bacterium]
MKDKRVVLTGASGLVGRALARHLAVAGARLILCARNAQRLAQAASELPSGHAPLCVLADLTDSGSLVVLSERIHEAWGGLDILINNAADVTSKPLMETSLQEIETQIHANITGTLQLCRLLVPLMDTGDKAMVNISSLSGYKPNPRQTVYSVSKAGMNAISEALRAELGPRGFHVLNVALMGIGTGPRQIPAELFARRLERAIAGREDELFLYRRTKWLMRLYRAFPALSRLR